MKMCKAIKMRVIFSVLITVALYSSNLAAQITKEEYATRRANLADKISAGSLLVISGSSEPDKDYLHFFQNPSFYYLTGFREPDATLVIVRAKDGKHSETLFVQPKNPEREVWSGRVAGPERATEITGIQSRSNEDLEKVIDSLLLIYKKIDVEQANRLIESLRSRKSAAEVALLQKAIDITVEAHQSVMRSIRPGMGENQVQALIEYTFRNNGSERPGFATIVGSGPNSTTLHYNTNNRVMQSGDVVVMDIGALYDGYSADVTRTVPVNGKFTNEQRTIYEIVRNAQEAAVRAAQIGAPSTDMGQAAASVIAQGLAKIGLIESPDATYDCSPDGKKQCQQYLLYYMHGLGHSIGLEVHDPGTSAIQPGRIVKGDIFTIEPGIYVRENLLEIIPNTTRNESLESKIRVAVEQYKNIGVRIEDDYLVTDKGPEWISRAPREIDEIEKLMGLTSE